MFDPLVATQLQGLRQHFRMVREGIISVDNWKDQEHPFHEFVQQPGVQQWWNRWGQSTFRGDFSDYFKAMMREGEAAG